MGWVHSLSVRSPVVFGWLTGKRRVLALRPHLRRAERGFARSVRAQKGSAGQQRYLVRLGICRFSCVHLDRLWRDSALVARGQFALGCDRSGQHFAGFCITAVELARRLLFQAGGPNGTSGFVDEDAVSLWSQCALNIGIAAGWGLSPSQISLGIPLIGASLRAFGSRGSR